MTVTTAVDLLALPIPPKPASFTAHGVPPGWDAINDAFGSWSTGRPIIDPRILVIHTNAASGEGTIGSAIRWGNAASGNTKPHGQAAKPRPAQLLPTNRRAIVNATWDSIQNRLGVQDSSFWSLGLETADLGSIEAKRRGYNWPTDCGPFLYDHEELIARWCAYKCIAHNIPPVWLPFSEHNFKYGRGIITHTDPFPVGYFTIRQGKTCPGSTKKNRTRWVIVPRAKQIYDAWTGVVPPPEDDMTPEQDKLLREVHTGLANLAKTESGRYQVYAGRYNDIVNRHKATQAAVAVNKAMLDEINAKIDALPGGDPPSPPAKPTKLRVVMEGTAVDDDT